MCREGDEEDCEDCDLESPKFLEIQEAIADPLFQICSEVLQDAAIGLPLPEVSPAIVAAIRFVYNERKYHESKRMGKDPEPPDQTPQDQQTAEQRIAKYRNLPLR